MAYFLFPSYISYVIAFVGGIYLLVAPISGRGRLAPHWVRVALWIVGTLLIAWSILGYIEYYSHYEFSALARQRLFQCKTLCSGACLGILILLLVSGELIRAFSRPRSAA